MDPLFKISLKLYLLKKDLQYSAGSGDFSPFFLTVGEKYVCFTHGLVLGYEKKRLTVHLWAANGGVTLKKR